MSVRPGIDHRADRPAGRDDPLRQPRIAGMRPEEVARAKHQRAQPGRFGQPALHFGADRALARVGMLRGLDLGERDRAGIVIVDRPRQREPRAVLERGGDAVVEHRQHELRPVAIARRVDRVQDRRDAARGAAHRGVVHRVAFDPFHARIEAGAQLARQPAHLPAVAQQCPRGFAADAAGRAEHQYRLRHLRLHR